jgi:hypothetical protein
MLCLSSLWIYYFKRQGDQTHQTNLYSRQYSRSAKYTSFTNRMAMLWMLMLDHLLNNPNALADIRTCINTTRLRNVHCVKCSSHKPIVSIQIILVCSYSCQYVFVHQIYTASVKLTIFISLARHM